MRNVWLNLSIDVASFCSFCFKESTFRSMEVITLSAYCKIRRIFTMKNPILSVAEESDNGKGQIEILPKSVEFPMGINFSNQVYSADKIGVDNSGEAFAGIAPVQMLVEGTKAPKTLQIAFGSHVKKQGKQAGEKEKKKQLGGNTEEIPFTKLRNGCLDDNNKDIFKSQHTTNTNTNSGRTTQSKNLNSQTKPSYRKSHKDPSNLSAKKTPVVYNTLEFHATMDENANISCFQVTTPHNQERDASEPPRENPKKQISKGSLMRGNTKSPYQKSCDKNKKCLKPPAGVSIELKNQKFKETNKNKAYLDNSTGSIQEEAEKENNETILKKSGSEKTMHESSEGLTESKKVILKEEKKKANSNAKNSKRKGPTLSAKAKPINKKGKENPEKKKQKKSPISKEEKKEQPTPSTALLEESVGGSQLNSFKINVWENDAGKDKDSEIEEIIEEDEKQSMTSQRECQQNAKDLH